MVALLTLSLGLGCARVRGGGEPPRRLIVVHASDMESELLGGTDEGGFARFQAVVRGLRDRNPDHALVVAAGDTFMPAPGLEVEEEDRPLVAVANGSIGLHATVLGNHEFDKGEAFLARMLDHSPFPFLTATVAFEGGPLAEREVRIEGGPTPWLSHHPGKLLRRGKVCVGSWREEGGGICEGFVVGMVGATTELLGTIASVVPSARSLPDLPSVAAAVQREVDALRAEGIDVVVLLSHLQGVHRELELLDLGLRGVDVIVAGGGDDRLANEGHRLLGGDRPAPICMGEASCYPLVRTGADGEKVVVVATDGQYRYVGSLGLSFDEKGRVIAVDRESRPWPVDDTSLRELGVRLSPEAVAVEEAVELALASARAIVGRSVHLLNGEREHVRNRETNLGNASADSLAHRARRDVPSVAFALRNGGGIRASIGAQGGRGISLLDLQTSLRFNDALVVVKTTHRVLAATLEAALRGAGTARGHFPQLSEGVLLVYDPVGQEQVQSGGERGRATIEVQGARIRELSIRTAGGAVEVVRRGEIPTPDAPVTFATLEYLARGGDGYFPLVPGELEIVPILDEGPVREQDAFLEFLRSPLWGMGEGYPDPAPGRRESFARIRFDAKGQ